MNLKKKLGKLLSFLLLLALSVTLFTGCTQEDAISGVLIPEETTSEEITSTETEIEDTAPSEDTEPAKSVISEDGTYTSKEEVAEYLHTYGHLPSNFIKKKAAQKLGWVSKEGNLWEVAPGWPWCWAGSLWQSPHSGCCPKDLPGGSSAPSPGPPAHTGAEERNYAPMPW